MRDVVLFHPGVQHSWQTALALQDLDALEYYATSILYQAGKWPYVLENLPGPIGRGLASRFHRFRPPRPIAAGKARTHGVLEWLERLATQAGRLGLARELNRAGNRRFGAWIARDLAARSGDRIALWGFDSSALEAFAAAQERRIPCVLDQTTPHRRYIDARMAEQFALYPEWFADPPSPANAAGIEHNDRELALAHRIVVGSQFCGQTLIDHAQAPDVASKIRVLPYCFDAANFPMPSRAPRSPGEPLRFLFAGQVSVNKGAHLLLEAFAGLPKRAATLTLLGEMRLNPDRYKRYTEGVTHLEPVPRAEVARIMAEHDVMVLPSFFEGSAVVLLEALASHMGLIQSRAAGNGATPATGLVLDTVTVETIREAMMTAIDDRPRVEAWRATASSDAKCYSFAKYREGVGQVVAGL